MSDDPELDLFDYSNGRPTIEDRARQNGMLYWLASDFLQCLGYTEYSRTAKPIQKAIQVMTSLGIDITEHFKDNNHEVDGKVIKDLKLSRFACYLVSMNADTKKPQVARAQAYFASLAEFFQEYIKDHEDIERVVLRDDVSEHERSLTKAAKGAGLDNFAYFQSKGYLGLYNMIFPEIKRRKGIPSDSKQSPLDFMGAEELGANIFRITQTEAKIRREGVTGQKALEDAAFTVGRKVRDTIKSIGGTMPENLPPAEDIKNIRSELKKTSREFIKSDSKPKRKSLPDK